MELDPELHLMLFHDVIVDSEVANDQDAIVVQRCKLGEWVTSESTNHNLITTNSLDPKFLFKIFNNNVVLLRLVMYIAAFCSIYQLE